MSDNQENIQAEAAVVKKHPLADTVPKLSSWDDWLTMWGQSTSVEWRAMLLKHGFKIGLESKRLAERVRFYLEVADVHGSTWQVMKESEEGEPGVYSQHAFKTVLSNEIELTTMKWRQVVADEAFNALGKNVFVPAYLGELYYMQMLVTDEEPLLPLVFEFFQHKEEYGDTKIPNLDNRLPCTFQRDKEVVQQVRDYLLRLCCFAWHPVFDCECTGKRHEKIRDVLSQHRNEFVALLWSLKKLDVLWEKGYDLNEASMEFLKQIAMQDGYPSEDAEIKYSIEDACGNDSPAARTYVLLKSQQEYKGKKEQIRHLEQEKREADAKLQELQGA